MTKSTSSTKFETRAYWRAHGERLRTTRQALKISEQEAATVYGVTLRTYQKWECGGRQGNAMRIMDGIKAFALKYNVSCDWIVLGRRHGIGRRGIPKLFHAARSRPWETAGGFILRGSRVPENPEPGRAKSQPCRQRLFLSLAPARSPPLRDTSRQILGNLSLHASHRAAAPV